MNTREANRINLTIQSAPKLHTNYFFNINFRLFTNLLTSCNISPATKDEVKLRNFKVTISLL